MSYFPSEMDLSKYRPISCYISQQANDWAHQHEFEYDKQWFTIRVLGFHGTGEDEEEDLEVASKYMRVLFPEVQNLLHRTLPHMRSMEVKTIQVFDSDSIVTFTTGVSLKPSIDNIFPGVAIFKAEDVSVMEHIGRSRHHKVTVKGLTGHYVRKLLSPTNKDALSREISSLRKIGMHPNVTWLFGVLQERPGTINGLLTVFIPGQTLQAAIHASKVLKQKWKEQIEKTVKYIHSIGVVWGDVKPSNIMVDDDMNVRLVDFGGGFTDGWVDVDLCGTVQGDEQGCEKLYGFIDDLPEQPSFQNSRHSVHSDQQPRSSS